MDRPRATSVATRSDSRSEFVATSADGLAALKLSRDRAIENEYCDKLSRPASAPFSSGHVTRLTNHRDLLPRGGNRLEARCHSTSSAVPPPIARNLKPGAARRVAETPPRPTKPCNPTSHPISPRMRHGHGTQLPIVTSLPFQQQQSSRVPSPTSTLPPRVPPISIEAGVPISQDMNSNPIRTQPRPLHRDDEKLCKKPLLVELDETATAKVRCKESEKPLTVSGRKPSPPTRRPSADSDHALIEVGDGKAKPGEHDYPCPRCGKCMCPYCKGEKRTTHQPRLLCGDRCLCNYDSIIDAVTCFCCVRTCFYHCSNRENDEICAVKPCSCQEPNRCTRWMAVIALTPLLPCLLCYPVARGCVKMCRACNKCMKPGCRCKESNR